jgi:uroporphyrinogen-III synthase
MGQQPEIGTSLVVLTRETEDNRELRSGLEARGLRVLETPCIGIESRPCAAAELEARLRSGGFEVIAFTSRRGVLAIDRAAATLRMFTGKFAVIGDATARILARVARREPDILGFGRGAASLAGAIAEATEPGRVLHVCGDRARAELGKALGRAGYEVERLVVYETRARSAQVVPQPAIVVFASPSAVVSFFAVNPVDGRFDCVAIGATTEEKLRATGVRVTVRSQGTDPRAIAEAVLLTALRARDASKGENNER